MCGKWQELYPSAHISLCTDSVWKKSPNSGAQKAQAVKRPLQGTMKTASHMAVAAAVDCLKGSNEPPQGLFFATTTNPYREKQGAAVIASALDLKRECLTADYTNSLRAGTIALRAAARRRQERLGEKRPDHGVGLPPGRAAGKKRAAPRRRSSRRRDRFGSDDCGHRRQLFSIQRFYGLLEKQRR